MITYKMFIATLSIFVVVLACLILAMCSKPAEAWHTPPPTATHLILMSILDYESNGNYDAVNESDTEYHSYCGKLGSYGGYQFSECTWDWIASKNNMSEWVGIRPDRAPPHIQDAMALALLSREMTDRMHGVQNYSWRHWGYF